MRSGFIRLTGQQLSTELRGMNALTVALVSLLMQMYAIQPVVQFCNAAGVNMTPFAAVFVFNDIYYTFLSTIMSLGMVALCADAPFLSQYQMQVLLRTGRKRWLCGQLVYLFILSLTYTAFWAVCPLLCAFGRIEWSNQWGKIWTTLSFTDAAYQMRIMLDIPYSIVSRYSPMEALMLCLSLRFLYIFMLGMIIFIGNLISRSCAGIVIGTLMSLMDYMLTTNGFRPFYLASPLTLTRISMLDPRNIWFDPTPAKAFIVLGGGVLVLALYMLLPGRRHIDI